MKIGIICIVACVFFAGCFEVEETTTFKTADSGDYTVSVDMGKMFTQLKMFGGSEQLNGMQNMDTMAWFKNLVAGDTLLSVKEKNAIQGGFMKIHLDKEKDEMKMTLAAPFETIESIGAIRSALFKLISSKSKMPLPGMDGQNMSGDFVSMLDINSLGFIMQTKKGAISTTIADSISLRNRIESDSVLQQVKPMISMMGSPVTYKSVYSFIAPVKNATGQNVTLSDNRKKVVVTNNLDELFENLSAFEYSITY